VPRALEAILASPDPPTGVATRWALALVRCSSAIVFVSFGVAKFVNHASETASFSGYGLPVPGVFAAVIGAIELLGGLLLLAGLFTRVAALLLAGDMLGAIVVSGILHGEQISLTLAPALLICMMLLIALGPGRLSLDARFAALPRAVGEG
jgi:putative oxidoreductase